MTTISHNRKNGSRLRVVSILCLLIALAALVVWRSQASSLLWRSLAPLLAARDSLDSSENAQLRADLASTTAALADRNALYEENIALKAQFGRDAGHNAILAGVLMGPPGIPYDTLVIDAGSSQDIAVGDLISAGGTTLIGTITEVYATTARVRLFSSPGSSYQAFILHAGSSVPVSMAGQGAGSMSGTVPAGVEVAVGDAVEFPGIAGGFVGDISQVDAKNGESFQTIYVRLPVDLFSLRFVEVQPAQQNQS